jgi:RNA polymerase sigma-70 factor, ECF subfamily
MIFGAAMDWERPLVAAGEIERLQKGDRAALEAVVNRYQHRLYRYLLRFVREPAAAEDLFQQTWLRVMQKVRGYDPERNFEGWLFAIAHNLAIDHIRQRRPGDESEPAEVHAATGGSALDGVIASERAAMLAAAQAKLPAYYREVLTLRFEEEMKLEQIAETAGIPISTVKSRLRRALECLRSRLEGLHAGA